METRTNEPRAAATDLERAEQTVGRIQAALVDRQTPCMAQIVELIREMTARPDSVSIQHLAELIERDVTVVAEVLRIANTIGYNPEGVEILTVPQAIQVIGFVKIRNLAVALLLLQHAAGTGRNHEARDMAVLAVTCGHIAEVGAQHFGQIEDGHGFVCAALRYYGELMLTTFLAEDCREARTLNTPSQANRGWIAKFGLPPVDLGRRVLESMNLPQGILSTLRDLPTPAELEHLSGPDAHLAAALDLADRVALWLTTDAGKATSLDSVAQALTKRYGAEIDLPKGALQEVLAEVDRRLSVLRSSFGDLPLLERVRSVALGRTVRLSKGIPTAPRTADPQDADLAGTPAPRTSTDADAVLLNGISALTDLLATTPVRATQVFTAAARAINTALDLVDTWIFRRPSTADPLVPFLGIGPLFPQLPVKSLIQPTEHTVFSVCLLRAETVLLSRPQDPRIRPYLPPWLATVTGVAPLVLLPVGKPGEVFALLCGIGEPGQLEELPTTVRQKLQVMAKLLLLAKDA